MDKEEKQGSALAGFLMLILVSIGSIVAAIVVVEGAQLLFGVK